jgi:membrane-associated phospholipid phosphatase
VVLVLGELIFLSQFVPLDLALYNWIEQQRGCDLSRMLSSEWPLVTLVTLVLLLVSYLCYQRRWREALHGTAIVVVGGFLGELLKTAFERPRPSVIPPLLVGNSFPSGHTEGALLLVGTMGFWLLRQPGSRAVQICSLSILGSLACIVMGQRLYLAHHWLSDVLGTVPLAVAWLCVTLSRPIGWRGARLIVVACGVLLVGYPLFYAFPALRFHLPSALSTVQKPLLSFSFGNPQMQASLQGEWGVHAQEAIGPITWMRRGEASMAVVLHNQQRYSVRFSARPFLQKKGFACFPLEVSLNKHPVRNLLLHQGWREYELYLEPAWITPGTNMLTFRTGSDFPSAQRNQEAVAFYKVALFRRGESDE